ncbi:LuxR family two component transcriptional regulator [Motilibacter rhizosphaerae]|uniref:LuxR family two component transcriptional regulator n=1 Tax=Motilibacter rhizosphaerae TaxID=598652 RepID=A0A4Q7NRB1_9ACTN|nr:response regulator transcription factor [Motilibacter rhizosphaerae]RZS89515.1 LuxR family two component transcriptional regulator [Motilibacter rhizosphaerae]
MTTLVDRAHGGLPAQRSARFTALVAVPNAFARETLARTLRLAGARDVLEAASAAEARIRARSGTSREVAVVAGALPDGSGATLVAELRALGWPHALLLSSTDDPYAVRAALAAGARGYLVVGPDQPAASSPVPSGPAGRYSPRGLAATLSAREIEVLALVADGQSNKEVGEALGLSALTVKSHLARIARKLGTGDRAEMVMVALRAGVIE